MQMIKNRRFNNNKTQNVSNRLFEVMELHEDEPITFQIGKRNKKQTNASSQDKNKNEKRKIMLVIPAE
jgi:prolyl-tRNA synthetase